MLHCGIFLEVPVFRPLRLPLALALILAPLAQSCGEPSEEPNAEPVDELGVGELDDEGVKADGWGAALDCKPIPNVPVLNQPEIVISLDGLTLHLRDKAGTYDRVFAIGPGAIDSKGKSYTPVSTGLPTGTFFTGRDTREVPDTGWGYYYPCRIWWTDTETGTKKPVFAGLPFIRLEGPPSAAYAIHGPVDAFSRTDGGLLRRGYVSHGCVRMASKDIVEVYARIRGKARTPVRVQQDVERDTFGRAVDLQERWLGAECTADSDCNYDGGLCRATGYGRSVCTKKCAGSCPDRQGYNTSRCVSDGAGGGMCVLSGDKVNNSCKGMVGRVQKTVSTFGRSPNVNVNACVFGTRGLLGDPCRAPTECGASGICEPSGLQSGPGFCSTSCATTCSQPSSICTTVAGQKRCVETCWGQDVCSAGMACEDSVPRAAGGAARACVPGD